MRTDKTNPVWQIAQRDYKFGKGGNKTLNKATYDAVGNHFRKLWGKEAGWAHSVLFTADLRAFSDRLTTASKKVETEVTVKQEEKEEIETKTQVKTKVATKRSVKDEDAYDAAEGKEKKPKEQAIVGASEEKTAQTRRTSKRLRKQ